MTALDYEIEINYSMYNPVYIPYLENPRNTEIFYGGSSSGKSNFVAARAIEEILSGGHNYLCCRKMGNSLTKSVFNELEKAINKMHVRGLFNIVPSQGHITCVNEFQILFSGLDDVEKVKSITPKKGVITDIWIEEATETARTDAKQLRKRLRGRAIYDGKRIRKRIIFSFNPIYKTHWIVKEFFIPYGWTDKQTTFENDKIRILKTTHLDNEFLDPEDHEELENEDDKYWHEVYTLGNWGILGDAIITNWRTEDLSKQVFSNIRHGLDFGFSNDPAAYVKCNYDGMRKKIYVVAGFHQTLLTNPELSSRLKSFVNNDAIFCDSAEPKSIKELKDNDINAKGVKKGADSVLFSIQWLQQHEIIVDSSLQGVINEFNTWQWKKDKDDNALPIPVDKDNHYIDAIRYALEIEYMGLKGIDLA